MSARSAAGLSGPIERGWSRKICIAGWRSTATSMSSKRPSTCGRIASFSNEPASSATGGFSIDTAKWFAQKCTRRSTKGVPVVSALVTRASTALAYTSRIMSPYCLRSAGRSASLASRKARWRSAKRSASAALAG